MELKTIESGLKMVRFKKKTRGRYNELYLFGINLGPHVYIKKRLIRYPEYEIWHVPSHSSWISVGETVTVPSAYYLVRREPQLEEEHPQYAEILYYVEPGREWRFAMDVLTAKAIQLGKENEPE